MMLLDGAVNFTRDAKLIVGWTAIEGMATFLRGLDVVAGRYTIS